MSKMYDKTEFFLTYFSRATEKELVVNSLENRFFGFSNTFKMLDLGCHNGSLLEQIFRRYRKRLPDHIDVMGIDPSGPAIEEFHNRVFGDGCQIRSFIGSAEEYFEDHAEVYSWILASQCLYWSDDLALTLRKIRERGEASLVILRGRKGIYEVQSRFRTLLGNVQEKLYSSKDIEQALTALEIPFEMENHQTEIHLPEPGNQESRWMNAFFLQASDDALSEKDHREIEKFTESLGSPMRHDVAFFWLGKAILEQGTRP